MEHQDGTISTFGEILMNIEQYPYRDDGMYSVFVPSEVIKQSSETSKLSVDTLCMVLFYTLEQADLSLEEDIPHPIAAKYNYCDIGSTRFIQEIVRAAKNTKQDCTPDDLVTAYEYYMEADAFYDFEEPPIVVTIRFPRNAKLLDGEQ